MSGEYLVRLYILAGSLLTWLEIEGFDERYLERETRRDPEFWRWIGNPINQFAWVSLYVVIRPAWLLGRALKKTLGR